MPFTSTLRIINGGLHAGRPKKGDQIIVTFAAPPSPSAFCNAWSSTSSPLLSDPNVVVVGKQPPTGNDTITVTDAADCTGGFHFGKIDLGQRGYFTANATFGGNVAGCTSAKVAGCSTIHWDGHNTLTITLGVDSTVQPMQIAPSIAVYTPDPGLGVAGTISSAKEEHF
jgi:hypothetical protein